MSKKNDNLDLSALTEALNFSCERALKIIDKIENKEPITLSEHLELDALIFTVHRFKRFINNKEDKND